MSHKSESSRGPPSKKLKQSTISFAPRISQTADFNKERGIVTTSQHHDYVSILKRLSVERLSADSLQAAFERERAYVPPPSTQLFQSVNRTTSSPDTYANSLLALCHSLNASDGYVASMVTGDGNCLFNAASILITGTEVLSSELRVRTFIELMSNRDAYMSHPSSGDLMCISPDFDRAVHGCAANGGYTCIWALFALASVLRRKIVSVYPSNSSLSDDENIAASIANTTLCPLSEDLNQPPFHIMWSRLHPSGSLPWSPDHFVPLFCEPAMTTGDARSHSTTILSNHESKPVPESLPILTFCTTKEKVFCTQEGAEFASSSLSLTPTSPLDIGLFATPELSTMTPEIRHNLLKNSWKPDIHFQFPSVLEGTKYRKFNLAWMKQFQWLDYSAAKNGAYCRVCVIFANRHPSCGTVGGLVITPLQRYKKALESFRQHEVALFHLEALEKSTAFLGSLENSTSIVEFAGSARANRIKRNRTILRSIIETIIVCGRQNFALRGHRDDGELNLLSDETANEGNFRHLLKYRVQGGDENLREHLQETAAKNATMISKTTQEQLIRLCGDCITKQIVAEVKKSVYFSVLADETTDISTKEQMAIVLRYVIVSCSGSHVRERFIGFIEVNDTTGETLADIIWKYLIDLDLNPALLRGQGYDGAANMSGRIRGVAARILEKNPLALYTHCCNHVLNLVVVKSCSIAEIRNMFGIVQSVANFFGESPKRMKYLQDAIKSAGCESLKSRLKKHCQTRWIEQADALLVFTELFDSVLVALDELSICDGSTGSTASQLSSSITTFSFLVSLFSGEFLLNYTKPLSVLLQKEGLDLCKAMNEVKAVQNVLQDIRDHVDDRFAEVYQSASRLGSASGIAPSLPRICGRQTHRQNVSTSDPETYYRTAIFIPLIDNLNQGLKDRFGKMQEDVSLASKLVPSILLGSSRCSMDDLNQLSSAFPDIPSPRSFPSEYDRWRMKWLNDSESAMTTLGFIDALRAADPELFPNIHIIMLVSATRPSSTASNERSFSVLKRMKTYLRSTMLEERLSSLALLHIHRSIPVSVEEIINKFGSLGPHRMAFL